MAERRLIWLMRVWACLFFGAGLVFLALPDYLIGSMNEVAEWLGLGELPLTTGPSGEDFWLVLAAAMMFLLAFLAVVTALGPRQNVACAYAIVVAKVASSAGGLAMYLLRAHALAFLLIFLIDFSIAVVTAAFLSALRPGIGASFRNASSH